MKLSFSSLSQYATHPFVTQSITVLFSSVFSNASAYLYHLFVGRILGPTAYGELGALLSLFYILNVVSGAVLNILTKYFSEFSLTHDTGQTKQLLIQSTWYLGIFSGIGLAFILIVNTSVSSFLNLSSLQYLPIVYGIFIIGLLTFVPTGALQGYQRFVPLSICTNVGGVLRLIFCITGAFFGVFWTLIANVASSIITYVLTWIPMRFALATRSTKLVISKRGALEYSIPTILATFGITMLYSVDVLLVKHFFSSEEAGLYASLSVLGKIIYFMSYAITVVLFPTIVKRVTAKKPIRKYVVTSLGVVGGISCILTVAYFLFPQVVVEVLFGNRFGAVVPYVGSFGVFITFFTLSNVLILICLAANSVNVWMLSFAASVMQILLIYTRHNSIHDIIFNNTLVTGVLFCLLVLYYYFYIDRPEQRRQHV